MPRTKKTQEEFTLPSDPKDLQSIRDAIYEIEGALTFIQDKKEYIKDVHSMLEEKFNMPKDLVTKMVKAHQDDQFEEMVTKNDTFEVTYEKVMTYEATMEDEKD